MAKIFRNKFVIILLLVIVFFFFGSITNTLVLNNRGVVVGMGLDCDSTGRVVLNCQILVAGEVGAEGEANDNYAILSATGDTFGEAVQNMMVDSAEYMSFAHCNSVIVGRSMIESGKLFTILDELLKNSKISENTNLVYYEGSPQEMLKQKVGINLMASFAIQRMIALSEGYVDTAKCTIKDYLTGVTAVGGCVVMPEVVVSEKIDEAIGSEQGKGRVILSLKSGACVTKDEVAGKLNQNEVGFYNIAKKDFRRGTFSMQTKDGERSVEFRDKSDSMSYDVDKLVTSVKINTRIVESLYINDTDGRKDDEKKHIERSFKDGIESGIKEIYERFSSDGVDIFGVYGGYKKKAGKRFSRAYPDFDEKFSLKVEVEVQLAP